MRIFLITMMLTLPLWAAVVPDGKMVPRDDGAPILPTVSSEEGKTHGLPLPDAPRTPGSKPGSSGGHGQDGGTSNPAGTGGDSTASTAGGSVQQLGEPGAPESQPLPPVV